MSRYSLFKNQMNKAKAGRSSHKSLTVICLLLSLTTFSQLRFSQQDGGLEELPRTSVITGSPAIANATPLTDNATAITFYLSDNEPVKKIQNIITLKLFEESSKYISGDFTVTVPIKIEYGHDENNLHNITRDFTITYSKAAGNKYNARNYFSFSDAEYVKITALPFTAPTVGTLDTRRLLVIDNEMRVTRYYALQGGIQLTQPQITIPAGSNGITADEANVTWSLPANTGHTHTQLEWAWVEDELREEYEVNGVVDEEKLFRNNSTRIDRLRNINYYPVPLLYGGPGRLYCRIRAVNIKGETRADGPWSAAQWVAFNGHNEILNWQSTASYAEEGKRKVVIQYFDGSLRGRQTVTKENVNNTTVTAETIYDGQGRAAIQILPTPGKTNTIAYTGGLNLFSANTFLNTPDQQIADDPADFFDLQPGNTASSITPALSTAKGTSRYYSPANDDITTAADKNIPDAEGYPYAVTRYTPDGTGRIMSQSGVGKELRMGSGHETKYFYGTPSQEELDGLFGTEVGEASHYFKNMVQDANGQMSVSYVDMHGRTIATALAGEAIGLKKINPTPANGYEGQLPQEVRFNLLNPATNIRKNNTLESITSLLVPVGQTYHFKYNLTPKALGMPATGQTVACYDCMYDLEISIRDESGDAAPIVQTFTNISLSADDDCNTSPINTAGFSTVQGSFITMDPFLTPGSYSIRKTLTVSEASLERYKEMYYERFKGQTVTELAQTIEATLIASSNCNSTTVPTCESCRADIGSQTEFRTKYITALGPNVVITPQVEADILKAFNDAVHDCDRFCNDASQLLDNKRSMMLADMIPFTGQYAREIGPGSMFDRYNIFSSINPARTPFYKAPMNGAGAPDNYRTTTGEVDPAAANVSAMTPREFSQAFTYSWADALLPHHPEYARLKFAEDNLKPSYNWITKFNATATYDDAASSTKNYLFTSDATLNDPFYGLPGTPRSAMVAYINNNYKNGLSLWQIAYGNAMCKDRVSPLEREQCYQAAPNVPPFNVTPALTPTQKDQVWINFRSLYAAERDNAVNKYIKDNAASPYAGTLVTEGFILHFPDNNAQLAGQFGPEWNWYPQDGNTDNGPPAGTQTGGTPAGVYISRCGSYIDRWRQSLLQCPALAQRTDKDQILNEITAAMVEVCKKGSDAANPFGSSNVAPSTPTGTGYRSFEEVINAKLAFYQISLTDLCSPFVIEFPKPYGIGPLFTKDQIAIVEGCNCDRLSILKAEASAASFNPNVLSSFNTYLNQRYGETITQSLFDQMNANCGKTESVCHDEVQRSQIPCYTPVDCGCTPVVVGGELCYQDCPIRVCETKQVSFVLQNPEPLPEFLKCGDGLLSRCITCAGLSALIAEFKALPAAPYNSGPVLTGDDLDEDQLRINIFFERFANYRTGFQYSWTKYLQEAAATNCNLATYQSNTAQTQTVLCGEPKLLTDPTGIIVVEDKCSRWHSLAFAIAEEVIRKQKEQLLANFEAAYRAKCLEATGEQFFVDYQNKEFHYTLYYYDMAGNLVKTVPPKGVRPNFSTAWVAEVEAAKIATPELQKPRPHELPTNYRFNSLNQVVTQASPDGGTSAFWYDKLGRLVVSQNAQQKIDNKYSYTLYDELGRITEVGQKPQTANSMSQATSQDKDLLNDWVTAAPNKTREQITYTAYDYPFGYSLYPEGALAPLLKQKNMRSRVSYSATKNLETDDSYFAATFYTYDIHGNVDALLQEYNGLAAVDLANKRKLITYDYDLISGKVNTVAYQPNETGQPRNPDAFYHRYTYDAENRLTEVHTSRDKMYWERDAAYSYYKHGPLARTELGQLRVQGIDYAYTLQGWLKGVNPGASVITNNGEACQTGSALDDLVVTSRTSNTPDKYVARNTVTFDAEFESGSGDAFETDINSTLSACVPGDGSPTAGTPHDEAYPVARDAYSFSLNYYYKAHESSPYETTPYETNDYKPISPAAPDFVNVLKPLGAAAAPLYNGNIAAMAVNIAKQKEPLVYKYHYDQLNRLVNMDAYRGLTNTGFTPLGTTNNAYKEEITYDPNGNIITYKRNGDAARGLMDDMTYHYKADKNQLDKVVDAATDVASDDYDKYGDIKRTQPNGTLGQADGNYTYDAIGNLKTDISEGITDITWNVYGKILSIVKNGNAITYSYDAAGNRISKTAGGATTIYVRDASGNVMSVYEKTANGSLAQIETHLYGSSRIGMVKVRTLAPILVNLQAGFEAATMSIYTRNEKSFELSNHLGNVLVAVSDKRLAFDSDNNGQVDYYLADVASAQDYYPGGMLMPGRYYSSGSNYRYGFNGKEMDKETKGNGNSYDFGARIYDPRVSRWLSVDPLQAKYPSLTPYNFVGNSPIILVDPDGREIILKDASGNQVAIIKADGQMIITKGMENSQAIHSYQLARNYLSGSSPNLLFLEKHTRTTVIQVTFSDVPGGASYSPNFTFNDLNGNKNLDPSETNSAQFDPTISGVILWNPTKGLRDGEGNDHSPALVLDHEAGHAVHGLTSLIKLLNDGFTPTTDGTDNAEEKSTIEDVNQTSKNLHLKSKTNDDGGNGTRKTHRGEMIETISPISNFKKINLEPIKDNLGGAGDGADGLLRGGGSRITPFKF